MPSRQANGQGTVFEDKDRPGRWIAITPEVANLITGQRRRVKGSGPSRTAAMRKARANADRFVNSIPTDYEAGPVTVERYARRWIADRERSVSPGTMRQYEPVIRLWVIPHLGPLAVSDVTLGHLRSLCDAMWEGGMKIGGVEAAYRVIRAMLNAAVDEDVISASPLRSMRAAITRAPSEAAETRGEARMLTAAEVVRILDWCHDRPVLEARWSLGLLTGMRQAEVLGLAWDDVDLTRGRVKARQQMKRQKAKHGCGDPADSGAYPCGKGNSHYCPSRVDREDYMDWRTKRGEGRWVALPSRVVESLRRLRQHQLSARGPEWAGFADVRTGQVHRLVVADDLTGAPMSTDEDWRWWRRILADCCIDHTRIHDARHTSASLALEAGVPDGIVQQSHGWASRSMLDRYQHSSDSAHRQAASMVDDVLAKAQDSQAGESSTRTA